MEKIDKKTMEQALKDGDFMEVDGYTVRKAGIQVRVVMPEADYKGFRMVSRPKKEIKSLLNAVAWTIHRCQVNKIAANVIVALDATNFPKLALGCTPFSEKDMTPVIVVSRRSEVKPV
ncbi:MAG: hypothetical protein WC469_06000 [Candidatus Omnitrophota bacterium]|jgi:hypothetical protein